MAYFLFVLMSIPLAHAANQCPPLFNGEIFEKEQYLEAHLHPQRAPEIDLDLIVDEDSLSLTWDTKLSADSLKRYVRDMEGLYGSHFPVQKTFRQRSPQGFMKTLQQDDSPSENRLIVTFPEDDGSVLAKTTKITLSVPVQGAQLSTARDFLRGLCWATADMKWRKDVPQLMAFVDEILTFGLTATKFKEALNGASQTFGTTLSNLAKKI